MKSRRNPQPSSNPMLLAALALLLAPAAEAQKNFAETATVVVIEVPVNVTVDGEPVRGLTADNFEVLDGRKVQPIVGFEVIDLGVTQGTGGGTAAPARSLPTASRRHFLLLFDLSFSEPSAVLRARDAAKEMVASDLRPEDLAAVVTYAPPGGLNVVLNFTSDRTQLKLALDTLGATRSDRMAAADPLGIVLTGLGPTVSGGASSGVRQETGTADAVRTYLDDVYNMTGKAERREQQDRVTSMTRQFAELGRMLDAVEGRKIVVYLSEGFDEKLLVGSGGAAGSSDRGIGDAPIDAANSLTPTAGESIVGGESYRVQTDDMYGSGKVQGDLQRALQSFKRANCTIHAIDIGGLRAGGSVRATTSGASVLTTMASETGGEVYRNFNDLSQAMEKLLQKTSVTYLLAVQPEDLKRDGNYHGLKVRLKNAPKGAEVQHRPGYYAPVPLAQQSKLERNLRTADDLFGAAGGALDTAVVAASFRAPEGKAYVPVLIEASGKSLTAGLKGTMLPIEVYAYALDAAGAVHDFFAQTLGIDMKQAGALLQQTGLKYYGHLDLDPGEYSVRVLVRNLETGLSSLEVVPLIVPDYAKGGVSLAPPAFPEPLGKWLMVREAPERQRNVPFPFMLKDQPFLPSASPAWPAQGEVQVPVTAYNLGQGPLGADVKLLSAEGAEQEGLQVTKIERLPGAIPGSETLLVGLKYSGLAPGRYRLQVAITDQGTGHSGSSSAELTVAK